MAVSRLVEELILDSGDVRETGKTLGKGSYGAVVEVEYLGKLCAAKRIHWDLEELDGKPTEEFKRECEIWSRLRHPNVVQLLGLLYEMSSDPATTLPAIVMEKMDCTLRQLVMERPREEIPLAVKIDVLCQVAQGLAYLHGQRPPVVHRDLTPNNILIKIDSMTAKLSDFGIARVFRQQTSSAGDSTGTAKPGTEHFMPPETFSYTKITYPDRIDVFSFGCIIICVVTHQWPTPISQVWQERGKLVVRNEVERREHFLSQFDSEEQNCFLAVVHKCLEYEPSERPKSMHLVNTMTELKDTYPLKSDIQLLKASNMELTKTVKELQQTCQSLEKELSEKKQSLESKQSEIEALSAKLSSCQAVVASQHTIPGDMKSEPPTQTGPVQVPTPTTSAADQVPTPATSAADQVPTPATSAADEVPTPATSAADQVLTPTTSATSGVSAQTRSQAAGPWSDVLESNVSSGESNPNPSSAPISSARERRRLPKEQVTPEPEPQPKKKRPQLNGTHPSNCSTGCVFVCLLLVIGLCLVGGGVFWIYSSPAPGLSALNQGEAEMSAGGKGAPKQDGQSHPDSKVVQILEKHQKRFINDLDAKEIAGTLQRNGVIPEEIAADIANARSKTKANEVLYDHLQSQSSEDDLKRLFQLCREKKGYSVMNAFGTDILVELERRGGSADSSSAPGRR